MSPATRCMVPMAPVQAARTVPSRVYRVSGRSGSLPMAKRWWRACEEAATQEQTPEPQHHPLRQGSYSPGSEAGINSARDPRAALCAGEGHAQMPIG